MKYSVVKRAKARIPRQFLTLWLDSLIQFLPIRDRQKLRGKEITLVFLSRTEAKKVNFQFRRKNYATDVLSFAGQGEILGDLVLCPEVLKAQAKEHGLSFEAELGYMVLHGVLHLLGYDHEDSEAAARRMFRLQDQIFAKLCKLHVAN